MGFTPTGATRRRAGHRARRGTTVAGIALSLTAGLLAGAPTPATAAAGGPPAGQTAAVRVIVRAGNPAAARAAEAAVRAAGGTVGRRLDLISGFAAEVPGPSVAAVQALPGVAEVTLDAAVRLTGATDATADQGTTLPEIRTATGAAQLAGTTGSGVGVALIDSGITRVKGLSAVGKVINGPDLSFESGSTDQRYLDTFGHGTHLAGIIAGRDAAGPAGGTGFTGVAPGAHLVSLKVATADGATDVSQVIGAIDWVVQHRNDPGLNIRVLNLAFGTDSVQAAQLDPLSYAVEVAWRKGIVVVVAVGNDGAKATRVSMPAANPYVIAVGAVDGNGTADVGDDVVADFSTRGNETRRADLLAPGRSVVSLRTPGSYLDVTYPQARVTSDTEERLFRGSGTSQATAVVAGAAALLLERRPGLTPDQVKRLLVDAARPLARAKPTTAGAGQLDVARAARAGIPADAVQRHPAALGTGSLESSRGSAHVVDMDTGFVLAGERDIMGVAWNPTRWAATAAAAQSWSGGTWNGSTWTGGGWTTSGGAKSWSAATWSGYSWAGVRWKDRPANDPYWDGVTWSARTWSARTWSARTWSARTWSARTWSGRTWRSRSWSSAAWPGSP